MCHVMKNYKNEKKEDKIERKKTTPTRICIYEKPPKGE